MGRLSHVTPRYVIDRVRLWWHERRYPNDPWLTRHAIGLLSDYLQSDHRGIEWGSGRSTFWFASRVAHLVSMEHNPEWFARVKSKLAQAGLLNVDQNLVEAPLGEESSQDVLDRYVDVVNRVDDASLDFALVDALARAECMLGVIPKLKPGAWLIFDNSNWYVPSSSRAPSPKEAKAGPVSEKFAEALTLMSSWEKIETTNGVWDTLIFIKPEG